jgi:lipid II:glycine glycyltransferase (peptidoglycan interpeptide bridge formation enzyme)
MIEIKSLSFLLRIRVIFFSKSPQKKDIFNLVQYNQSASTSDLFGFWREKSVTKVISLRQKEEDIFKKFKKNTRYEINRAQKEGISFRILENLEEFVNFYNSFADSKKIPQMTLKHINNFKDYLIITVAVHNDDDLVMHAYLVDEESERVRLLKSASLFRYEKDPEKKYLISMANRFLHYQDMLYFKSQNYQTYDLGGYACNNDNMDFIRVNRFKDSFGGELIEESNYISYPMMLFLHLAHLIRRPQSNK